MRPYHDWTEDGRHVGGPLQAGAVADDADIRLAGGRPSGHHEEGGGRLRERAPQGIEMLDGNERRFGAGQQACRLLDGGERRRGAEKELQDEGRIHVRQGETSSDARADRVGQHSHSLGSRDPLASVQEAVVRERDRAQPYDRHDGARAEQGSRGHGWHPPRELPPSQQRRRRHDGKEMTLVLMRRQ